MVDANLLVTFDPSHAGSAKDEIDMVLKEIKKKAKHLDSEIDGLFKLNVANSKGAVKSLNKLFSKKAELFEKTCHWIPIDKWVKTSIKDMQKEIKKMQVKIKKADKWKLSLSKRRYDKHGTMELVMKLTEVIDKPNVDLKKPKKIMQVEIIGNKAGLALLNDDEFLNTMTGKK